MHEQSPDQTYLDGCAQTTRLIKEIKLYTVAMEAAFETCQKMIEAKPAHGDNVNQLIQPWFDLVERFQVQHQEIMEMLKAKQTEFYAHYDPFQEWAEEHGYVLRKENEKWPDLLRED